MSPLSLYQAMNEHSAELGEVVNRNIRALIEHRRAEDRHRRLSDRAAGTITRFTGSMAFVYLHVLIFGLWILVNAGMVPGPRFDPSFVILAMAASVEAIFLSTFVLITQNRMGAQAEKRAELDLQISLLAEHEITRLMQLVIEIGERLKIEGVKDPDLEELRRDVQPERVLDRIEEAARKEG
jgi:uncharacterized membrane protein